MNDGARTVVLAMAVMTLAGCGEEEASPPPEAGFAAAWAEFLAPDQVRAALPLLAERKVAVYLAWHAAAVDDPARLALAADAAAAGVTLAPWLLLDEADGYWPGSTNAESFDTAARALLDAWEQAGLAPTVLIVDMELRIDRSEQLTELLSAPQPDVPAIVTFFQEGIDRQAYADATQVYAGLTAEAQERGWRVALTTLPQVLDDYADDDDDLRQALGIPVESIAWDAVTVQAYRTLFGDLAAGLTESRPTPFFVYDYAQLVAARFGARGGVDIGLVGAGVTDSSIYADGPDLLADVHAARAAGLGRELVQVYSLDGILGRPPAEGWLEAPAPAPAPPPEDEATAALHDTMTSLDGLLDE